MIPSAFVVGISLLLLPLPLLLNSLWVYWTLNPELCDCLRGQHRAPCSEQGLMAVWQAQAAGPSPLLGQ